MSTPETTPQPQAPAAPESGMWAPYVPPTIGEAIDELALLPSFVLLDAKVRENVDTSYGKRTAVDLYVATTTSGEVRVFSGFTAGIVGQAKRKGPNDLPAVARIVDVQLERGATKQLMLLQPVPAGADVGAIAASLPAPLLPKQQAA